MTPILLALLTHFPAQSSTPSESGRHAIVDARIEVGNGTIIERGTIVIENGLITAVGTETKPPLGTHIFDGKGLTVTPGFIDAWCQKGVTLPPAAPDQDTGSITAEYAPATMRDANRKGIQPELETRNLLNLSDEILKPYRSAGFTTAMIVPAGGYLGGVGSLVNLGGRPKRDSIMVPRTVLSVNFSGDAGGDGYPGSLLGRITQVRQAFFDSQWRATVEQAYAAGGSQRPPSDAALEALTPALANQIPSVFAASTPAELDRALLTASELSLKSWLLGGKEAYRRLDEIKATGTPVILAVNFGEEPPVKSDDEPSDRLAERKRLFNELASNAAQLNRRGITFALTSHGCKDFDDFWKHVRLAVAAGLPREVALRALTVVPAQMYGVSQRVGTIEVGKVANIVARDGDFLGEKTKVKMIYIDGRRIDPAAKPLPPGQKPAPVRDGGDR